jgi:hypothetical protein
MPRLPASGSARGVQGTDANLTPAAPGAAVAAPAVPAPPKQRRKKLNGCPLAALIVGALLIIGIVIFAVAVNNGVDELSAKHAAQAISRDQFNAVQLRVSRTALEQQLGKSPENAAELPEHRPRRCGAGLVVYLLQQQGREVRGAVFQFCFDGDTCARRTHTADDLPAHTSVGNAA